MLDRFYVTGKNSLYKSYIDWVLKIEILNRDSYKLELKGKDGQVFVKEFDSLQLLDSFVGVLEVLKTWDEIKKPGVLE